MAYQIPDSPRQGSRDFPLVVAAFLCVLSASLCDCGGAGLLG